MSKILNETGKHFACHARLLMSKKSLIMQVYCIRFFMQQHLAQQGLQTEHLLIPGQKISGSLHHAMPTLLRILHRHSHLHQL